MKSMKVFVSGILAFSMIMAIGCESKPEGERKLVTRGGERTASGGGDGGSENKSSKEVTGWGVIKGRIVWDKGDLPKMEPIPIDATKEPTCADRPSDLLQETYVVNPDTKGMRNCFVFIYDPAGIHPELPQTPADVKAKFEEQFNTDNGFSFAEMKDKVAGDADKMRAIKAPTVIDQVKCQYVPHSIAVREGQPLIALNAEPISHNIKGSGTNPKNVFNFTMPKMTLDVADLVAEKTPVKVECSIHSWMNMNLMIFDHPYYAVTDENGNFEIKLAPAGEVSIAIHDGSGFINVDTGGKGSIRGVKKTVTADGVLDLGDIKYKN